jgi:transposase
MPHIKELKQLLSGYFSFSRHGLECLAYFIFGILTVRTVNLSKIANSCGSPAKSNSIFRRFQRLIKHLKPSHKQLFNMIESVFKLEGKLTLCLDRTNWKLGKVHINYLVISIAYNGTAIPVIWSLLTDKKCGNSDFEDRRRLCDRLWKFLEPSRVEVLLADREFVSADWIAYLKSHEIPFIMRAKESLTTYNNKGNKLSLSKTFNGLKQGQMKCLNGQRDLLGCDVYIACKRLADGQLLILVSNFSEEAVCELYRMRWQIETLFSAMKQRGFNLESTHINDHDRLSALFFLTSIAFIWAYRQGDIALTKKLLAFKPKKHGYAQCSIVRAGLDIIAKAISEMLTKPKKIIASLRLIFRRNISQAEERRYLGVM